MEKIYYKDINKAGKIVYYSTANISRRYVRASRAIVEFELSTGIATVQDYIPNKPYEEMTERQLAAALNLYGKTEGCENCVKSIVAEIAARQ